MLVMFAVTAICNPLRVTGREVLGLSEFLTEQRIIFAQQKQYQKILTLAP
jgi:hypothetical protein